MFTCWYGCYVRFPVVIFLQFLTSGSQHYPYGMGRLPAPSASLEPGEEESPQDILLEFRAGRMVSEGRLVHADPRKGVVRIVKADDSLMHFQWWDLVANNLEEDQIVFPEEATFEKVSQSSGRVYILKFKHDQRRFFYWMQGPRVEDDEQLCSNVKHYLNQPLDVSEELEESAPQATSGASQEGETAEASSRNVDMGGYADPPASTGPVQLADLQRILHGLGQASSPHDATDAQYRDTGPSFTDILKPDVVLPLLDPASLEERLVPYLPEGVQTLEAIGELMQSPQFQQQLDLFTHVLRSGQLDWAQFGIDPSNYNFTVASFLEAIEDQATTTYDSKLSISTQDGTMSKTGGSKEGHDNQMN